MIGISEAHSTEHSQALAMRVKQFVREVAMPYQRVSRTRGHGLLEALLIDMRDLARDGPTECPSAKKIKRDAREASHV